MTPMRFLPLLILALVACDDLNKPAQVPKSEPRTACFSDVECPGSKCMKDSANDIQGHCATTTTSSDGGTTASDAAAAPEPVIKPAPGDIQL
jgi:hypothetical protein